MNPDPPPPEPAPGDRPDNTNHPFGVTTYSYDRGSNLTTVTYQYGPIPDSPGPPAFQWEHLHEKRLFALTGPDGKTEHWRDNPTRYLVVERDPTAGTFEPVLKRCKPVWIWLCREEREVR